MPSPAYRQGRCHTPLVRIHGLPPQSPKHHLNTVAKTSERAVETPSRECLGKDTEISLPAHRHTDRQEDLPYQDETTGSGDRPHKKRSLRRTQRTPVSRQDNIATWNNHHPQDGTSEDVRIISTPSQKRR